MDNIAQEVIERTRVILMGVRGTALTETAQHRMYELTLLLNTLDGERFALNRISEIIAEAREGNISECTALDLISDMASTSGIDHTLRVVREEAQP